MTYLEAVAAGPVGLIGVDPGPVSSAYCAAILFEGEVALTDAAYLPNSALVPQISPTRLERLAAAAWPGKQGQCFLCYETCGAQGKFVGESTFETAAVGGEIRHWFRSHVSGTYAFKPSEWRYLLCGQGNAGTPLIYAEECAMFKPTGAGGDPYKGSLSQPGPLRGLHIAGQGGNMPHMKDALGVALALTRAQFRTGADPEKWRRPW
jgi:hypothetical protein